MSAADPPGRPPPWRTHSLGRMQTLASLALGLVGLLLVVGLRHGAGPGLSDARAGLLLGVLLLTVSLVMLLRHERQLITIDAQRRTITLERRVRWATQRRVVLFNDVVDVQVCQAGDHEGGTPFYYVNLSLRGGTQLALFHGFFEGALSRDAMQARCDRLRALLHAGEAGSAAKTYR